MKEFSRGFIVWLGTTILAVGAGGYLFEVMKQKGWFAVGFAVLGLICLFLFGLLILIIGEGFVDESKKGQSS